ncbi:cytochrome b [Cardiobacteriaceae bacterium TAE3-ERU3]|nr:cytochrome b [Cardiobacteriaceae bacterium TAE3-ERU3]
MSADTRNKLSLITVVLHWVVAIGIIAMMCVGAYMSRETAYLYPIHKSIGIILFAIILVRVIWRAIQGIPPHVNEYKKWEMTLSKVIFWVLIIGTLLFPISGMLMSYFGGRRLDLFDLQIIAANIGADGKPAPINAQFAGIANNIHGALLPVMVVAIALHIAGAYKHHFVDKDGTMRRIMGKYVS